ncbi:MATE family efflux transporter [Blastomonas sp.]|uniref:MATE family efflux transporter n=1 Tax=Blastomonas sp. TaxID=1909299 RepID=UPI00391B07FD
MTAFSATSIPADARPASLRIEIRALLLLAGPLVLGNLAQMAIHTTEVIILGRYSVQALAAAALAVNLYFACGTFGMGLMTAASPMIAAERGRRGHSVRDIRRTVRQGFWVALAASIPIWGILWNAESLFLAMGQQPDLSRDAGQFMRVAMWGLLPWLLQFVLRLYVSALERPIWGVIVTLCGVGVNLVACWALVFGNLGFPEMGLMGAAYANLIANCTLFIVMALVVSTVKPFRRYRIFGRFWVADWPRFAGLFRLGLPIAITFAFEVAIFSAAAFLMGLISRDSLAAHAVAIQIASFAFMVPFSLSQAATVRVGLHHGRRDAVAASRAGWAALGVGVIAACAMSAIMTAFPEFLVGLFIDPADATAATAFQLALGFIVVAAIFQLVDAVQAVGAGVLRGLQDTRWPMIFAAFGYWVVGMGTAWFFAFNLGWDGIGVWIGLAAGLAVVSVLMVGRWMMRGRLGLGVYQ